MTKQADVKCPKCGHEFVVRQVEPKFAFISEERWRDIWKHFDAAFDEMRKACDKFRFK